jgi:hypothetical protein
MGFKVNMIGSQVVYGRNGSLIKDKDKTKMQIKL